MKFGIYVEKDVKKVEKCVKVKQDNLIQRLWKRLLEFVRMGA